MRDQDDLAIDSEDSDSWPKIKYLCFFQSNSQASSSIYSQSSNKQSDISNGSVRILDENGAPFESAEMMQRSFDIASQQAEVETLSSAASVNHPPVQRVTRPSMLSSCLFYFCCFSRFRRINVVNNFQP